jgi:hypothetical protein
MRSAKQNGSNNKWSKGDWSADDKMRKASSAATPLSRPQGLRPILWYYSIWPGAWPAIPP